MSIEHRTLNWRLFAFVALALCLVALVLHPLSADHSAIGAFLFSPIFLFGLALVPRSLWPPCDMDEGLVAPVLNRTDLFQRPPPCCKN